MGICGLCLGWQVDVIDGTSMPLLMAKLNLHALDVWSWPYAMACSVSASDNDTCVEPSPQLVQVYACVLEAFC